MDPRPGKSWTIHTRPEIISKYEIIRRIGSGAYSDFYLGRRISDGAAVTLKEIHDHESAFREFHVLRALHGHPNVVALLDHFFFSDADAVLVLEFLRTDPVSDIGHVVGDIPVTVLKRWMIQILSGVEACHRAMIVHRDLKPGNLLFGDDGTLKIADFGQARMLMDYSPLLGEKASGLGQEESTVTSYDIGTDGSSFATDSDIATCTTSDDDNDVYLYGADDNDRRQDGGCMTACVGTRWFRAPELLFGSTDYGLEVDLWSLGCVFAELFTLRPIFPGTSDIDQLSKISNVLGNLTEEVWSGCVKLPDFGIISFRKVESPIGIEGCLPNRSAAEVSLVKRLVCYDPAGRATATELIRDKYFGEEPLPFPGSKLRAPFTKIGPEVPHIMANSRAGNYSLNILHLLSSSSSKNINKHANVLEIARLALPRFGRIADNSHEPSTGHDNDTTILDAKSWLEELTQTQNDEATPAERASRRREIAMSLCTAQGFKFFKWKLAERDSRYVNVMLGVAFEFMFALMKDPIGCLAFSSLVERCSHKELKCILAKLTMSCDVFLVVVQDKQGANSVKRLIKMLNQSPLVDNITSTLVKKFMPIMANRISSLVILKCFECLDHKKNEELFEKIISNCVELAVDNKACGALNESIAYFRQPHRDLLLDKISSSALHLSQDPSGNYVVSEVLNLCIPRFTEKICESLQGCFVRLSTQKAASHVVQKCLESEIGIVMVLQEFLDHKQLYKIARDQYGNYVMQTLLNNTVGCEGYQGLVDKLYEDRRLYQFGCGKKVYYKIMMLKERS